MCVREKERQTRSEIKHAYLEEHFLLLVTIAVSS